MPTYEYACLNCHEKMEVTQKISDDPLKNCLKCHQPSLKRGFGGGIGFQLKGAGFYKNDYASGQSETTSSAAPSSEGASCQKASCCPCSKNP